MGHLLILLMIFTMDAGARADVSSDGCQLSQPRANDIFTAKIDVGRVHLMDANNSFCFSGATFSSTHFNTCCTSGMESALLEHASKLIREKVEGNLNKAQGILKNHSAEFDRFVMDSIEYVRQWTIQKLNTTYYINDGMLDEVDGLFGDMLRYVHSETSDSRETIARTFLRDLYSELITQKTRRRSTKYTSCGLNVISHIDPYFLKLHRHFIYSIIGQPLIDAKAYLRGLGEIREIFSRLEGLTISEECAENVFKLTGCPYCMGHGYEVPPCPSFCPRLYKGCTLLHRGVFFKRWKSFVSSMRLIAENMIQIPFTLMKLSIAIGHAVQDFDFLWRRTQYRVESICGARRRSKLFGFIGEISAPPYVARDYYAYAVSLADENVVGNLTVLLTDPETLCEPSLTETPGQLHSCWNGTNISHEEADPGLVLLESDTPSEVLREARALKKLTHRLRQATVHRVDNFHPFVKDTRDKRKDKIPSDKIVDADNKTTTEDPLVELSTDGEMSCPSHWVQYNSSCYFVTSPMRFRKSRRECITRRGDLSSILSSEENNFISDLVVNRRAWIGAKKGRDGEFFWVDGTDWMFNQTVHEERNKEGACVEVVISPWGRGIWRSSRCSDRNIGVCKIPL